MQKNGALPTSEEKKVIQLIVFLAGNEEFGVPIYAVREIIKMSPITPIPDSPDFIRGIINVRGEIVTVIDVKARFSLPPNKNNDPKHIVVTKQEEGLFGLVVDEVIEVLRIGQNDIKPAPTLVTKVNRKYIDGVVTHNDRLIILLDLNCVLSQKDLVQLSSQTKARRKKNKIKPIEVGNLPVKKTQNGNNRK